MSEQLPAPSNGALPSQNLPDGQTNPELYVPAGTLPTATPTTAAATVPLDTTNGDVHMMDVSHDQPRQPSPPPAAAPSAAANPPTAPSAAPSNAPSPAPGRTGTPMRNTNPSSDAAAAAAAGSRAASAHPDPGYTMPSEPAAHGAPVRQYLNSKVTPALLEGMKMLAKEQPKDPLRALGEFLLARSKEVENSS
ncbi:putative dpy-30 domain-protein [Podospora conica]|nr:putative dpy-30 domain-protein [Schizothecium conicum]